MGGKHPRPRRRIVYRSARYVRHIAGGDESTTLLEGITKEMCISIEGLVEKRDEDTYNPKLPTGTIELEAKKVTVLGKVYQQLPFEIMTSKETARGGAVKNTVI